MKRFAYLAALAGAALVIVLIVQTGYQDIFHAFEIAGWGLLWLVPYHLLPLGLDATGWRVLIKPRDPERRARLPFLLWAALVRQGVARLLPVASVGGELVGIRLIMLRGIDGAAATASVVAEVLLSLVSQYLFTAVGVLFLIMLLQVSALTTKILLGLLLTFPAPLLLLLLLRNVRIFQRLQHFAERMLGGRHRLASILTRGANLDTELQQLIARHGRLVAATVWQFASMLAGSFEIWLALKLLGHPLSPAAAVALESITLGIRHLAFLVPAGLGVQEAGLLVFGQMLGLSSDTALALSLIKRMRELLLGVPALISWQVFEVWHQRRRRARDVRCTRSCSVRR